MRFDLACYESQLGHPDVVWALLVETFRLKDTKEVRLRVLDAPDLTPFWEYLGKM